MSLQLTFLILVSEFLSFSKTFRISYCNAGIRYNIPFLQSRTPPWAYHKSSANAFTEIDGMYARRVNVTKISEILGTDMFFYEIVDWASMSNSISKKDDTTLDIAPVYVVGSFTYGGRIWPACLGVALNLIRDKAQLLNKTVLDVGCGVGLASLTAAMVGATKVIASDVSSLVLKMTTKAAQDLSLTNIDTLAYDILGDIPLPEADVVVFADVLYSKQLGRGVAKRVAEAKSRGSWVIVGSAKGRDGHTAFLQGLQEYGITETFVSSSQRGGKGNEGGEVDEEELRVLTELGWENKQIEYLEINRPSL